MLHSFEAAKPSASLESQQMMDASIRKEIVGVNQAGFEQLLNEAQNGVWVLFTQDIGTPLMIGADKVDVPEGLIAKAQLPNFETSVLPRVKTAPLLPKNGVNCLFIHVNENRVNSDDKTKLVDRKHYDALLEKHKDKIIDQVISQAQYDEATANGMPAAFYYYFPKGSKEAVFSAVYAKQINSLNTKAEAGFYNSAVPEKLENANQAKLVVNQTLKSLGYPLTVEGLVELKDLQSINPSKQKFKHSA